MTTDKGWILTYTGKQFWPLNPRIEDIDIVDIAHALSNICRFTGHVREFYSVGEHSLRSIFYVPEYLKLTMLLHDASEAYLCDVSRPVKHAPGMEAYRAAEKRLQDMIGERFDIASFADPLVHETDNRMLMTERRDLMSRNYSQWSVDARPYLLVIEPKPPKLIERLFLEAYEALTNCTVSGAVR